MANTTGKLYIRSRVGYRKLPKRIADLPENEKFVLTWYDGKSKKAKAVGRFADAAQTALINKEAELKRLALGGSATACESTATPEAQKPSIAGRDFHDAVLQYLAEVKRGKAKKTYLAYSIALEGFSKVCKAQTIEAMTREDVLRYTDTLRDSRLTPRTIANRLAFLKTFFKHFQLSWPMFKTDRVKFTEKTVEAYSVEDLKGLFAAANQEESELFHFLLGTGVREQESALTHAEGLACVYMQCGLQDCCWKREDSGQGQAVGAERGHPLDTVRTKRRLYPGSTGCRWHVAREYANRSPRP